MIQNGAASSSVQGSAGIGALVALVRDPRGLAVAVLASVTFVVVVAVPTDLIDTQWFTREIPPTWWAWPSLALSSVLGGLVAATYVKSTQAGSAAGGTFDGTPDGADRATTRDSYVAGVLTFFAVGCPVCNKLVMLALGAAGAVSWFEPFQPLLQVAAVALLTWALVRRLRNRASCPSDRLVSPRPEQTSVRPVLMDALRTPPMHD